MQNVKLLTAVVLVVTLVLCSMAAATAAEPLIIGDAAGQVKASSVLNTDRAVALKDLGLYAGIDANDPAAGLEDPLTTQDSLVFLARLFGYNEAANALTEEQVTAALAKFDDAQSIADYAKNVVAYSANNSILNGITADGKFFVGARDAVTAERFATFMLKQMGYTVADYKESVARLAEVKGSKVAGTITGDLTRDGAVGIMYGTLEVEKASGRTVIADIVGDNADLKAIAEKAGLLIAGPVSDSSNDGPRISSGGSARPFVQAALAVQSVTVLNLKQIEIRFNREMDVDSAQDQENYQIKDKDDTEKRLTDSSCRLGEDRRTVTITFDYTVLDRLANASKVKVIVKKDIMAADKKTLTADREFEIDVQDGILPTVEEVRAIGEKRIQIIFSEPVMEGGNDSSSLTNSNFKVESGTYTYDIQKATLNLNVIDLEVGTSLTEGPVSVTVNEAGLTDNNVIQDYAGYKVFKKAHTFNYVKDTAPPVVQQYIVNKDQSITIVFDEALDEDTAYSRSSYTVTKVYNDEEAWFSFEPDEPELIESEPVDSEHSVELYFAPPLADNTEYRLSISHCKDLYGNEGSYQYTFTTSDYKAPEVVYDPESDYSSYTVPDRGEIYILYSEPMNEGQMLDLNNYSYSVATGGAIEFAGFAQEDTITRLSDRMVRIYMKALDEANDSTTPICVKIAPITDLAGKKLENPDGVYIIEFAGSHGGD